MLALYECAFRSKEEGIFAYHAAKNHPLSSVFFDKTFVKEENLDLQEDYSDDYKDPLTTPSENLGSSRNPFSKLLLPGSATLPVVPVPEATPALQSPRIR